MSFISNCIPFTCSNCFTIASCPIVHARWRAATPNKKQRKKTENISVQSCYYLHSHTYCCYYFIFIMIIILSTFLFAIRYYCTCFLIHSISCINLQSCLPIFAILIVIVIIIIVVVVFCVVQMFANECHHFFQVSFLNCNIQRCVFKP